MTTDNNLTGTYGIIFRRALLVI